ncbi:MAG: ferritin-like domain-containing protein [Acidobacteria bacterium]|nr:ferritin-like domain-containing protein [Acidobacteriota bacterium]
MMKIEEAIKTAIEYEIKVRDVYEEAVNKTDDETGKRIFSIMAKEENYHVEYLRKKLKDWEEDGVIRPEKLKTAIPSEEKINSDIANLEAKMQEKDYSDELLMLHKALEMEDKTMSFYEKVVGELDGEHKQLFANFLKIEKNHKAIVQAEIDQIEGAGFWFDFQEFNLEVE